MGELTKGVVTDDKDPGGGYRVEVSLPSLRRKDVWCDVASFYASAKGGACFLPEQGDEVLVAFIDGDQSQPVVVGSLYSKQTPPPSALHGAKRARGVQTSSGAMVRFDDDSPSVEVSMPDASMAIDGSGDLSLRADKDLSIKGMRVEVEAATNAKIEGGTEAALVGGAVTTVSGPLVRIN